MNESKNACADVVIGAICGGLISGQGFFIFGGLISGQREYILCDSDEYWILVIFGSQIRNLDFLLFTTNLISITT